MELTDLIGALTSPTAYQSPVEDVEVIQTHISVVFLAGDFVYKVKKPVDLGFLDFTTLELREHYCHEEVRLNRRLAPAVYLGVVPVVQTDDGLEVVDEPGSVEGPVVEWAVRMLRLPTGLTMADWAVEGTLRPYHVAVLGRRVAGFHARADSGPTVSEWGRFETVAGNARENLEQTRSQVVGDEERGPITRTLHTRVMTALERQLDRLESLIESRAERGVPRDTHGDLHLDHVYIFADRDPPDDLVIIDCIEFNERFRYSDPVSDIAFLDMDLRYHGLADLAGVLTDAYFEAAGDEEGRALLRFYSAYRAAVRAKVSGMRAAEIEVPAEDRLEATEAACAHWLLALDLLEPPLRRPALILVGGLPGTGKSTLARSLGKHAGLETLSSDITRKRLAGLEPETPAAAAFGAGIYSDEWNERTYAALRSEAETRLRRGERVLVDASFREDARRCEFVQLAARLRVRTVFLALDAPGERVRERILARDSGPSDADVDVYERAVERWEPPSAVSEPHTRIVDTGQSPAWSVEQSLAHLRGIGALS